MTLTEIAFAVCALLFAALAYLAGRARGAHGALSVRPLEAPEKPVNVEILAIRNEVFFAIPDGTQGPEIAEGQALVMSLISRAFEKPDHADWREVAGWLHAVVHDDHLVVLAARVAGERDFTGLAILSDWMTPFSPLPWMLHFYAETPAVRRRLSKETGVWARARGHTAICGINRTGYPDERWIAAHARDSRLAYRTSYAEFQITTPEGGV